MELFAHFFGSNLGFLRVNVWQDPAMPKLPPSVWRWSRFSRFCKIFLDIVKPPLLSFDLPDGVRAVRCGLFEAVT
jgi:hypothetical protein